MENVGETPAAVRTQTGPPDHVTNLADVIGGPVIGSPDSGQITRPTSRDAIRWHRVVGLSGRATNGATPPVVCRETAGSALFLDLNIAKTAST